MKKATDGHTDIKSVAKFHKTLSFIHNLNSFKVSVVSPQISKEMEDSNQETSHSRSLDKSGSSVCGLEIITKHRTPS